MLRTYRGFSRPILWALLGVFAVGMTDAIAGDRPNRRAGRTPAVRAVPTMERIDPVYGDRLGTFFPTPAVVVQGNYPSGGGYAPLGIWGDHTMSLYGPLSSFRTATAPVATYVRGYDGIVRPAEAISTSYPNLPYLSPLAYPTRANYYYAPRIRNNPGEESAIEWLDHN